MSFNTYKKRGNAPSFILDPFDFGKIELEFIPIWKLQADCIVENYARSHTNQSKVIDIL